MGCEWVEWLNGCKRCRGETTQDFMMMAAIIWAILSRTGCARFLRISAAAFGAVCSGAGWLFRAANSQAPQKEAFEMTALLHSESWARRNKNLNSLVGVTRR